MRVKKIDKLACAIMGFGLLTIALKDKGYEIKLVKKKHDFLER